MAEQPNIGLWLPDMYICIIIYVMFTLWLTKQPTKAVCGPSLRKLGTPVLRVCDRERERETDFC
jgi:hypothetical protein